MQKFYVLCFSRININFCIIHRFVDLFPSIYQIILLVSYRAGSWKFDYYSVYQWFFSITSFQYWDSETVALNRFPIYNTINFRRKDLGLDVVQCVVLGKHSDLSWIRLGEKSKAACRNFPKAWPNRFQSGFDRC